MFIHSFKFQAQRKFAQGQGTSASSLNYSNAFASSQQSTPLKETRDPPPELLPNQRPNTEDFLTFLCFRTTSMLPPELDFLNPEKQSKASNSSKANTKKDQSNAQTNSNTKKHPTPSSSNKGESDTKSSSGVTSVKQIDKTAEIESSENNKSSAAFPGAVRKRADKTPMNVSKFEKKKNESVAVALKNKYKQQRLAKLNQAKNTAILRRTRAHPGSEEVVKNEVEETKLTTEKTPVKRKSGLQKQLSSTSLDEKPPKKSPRTILKGINSGAMKNVKVILNKEETKLAPKRGKKKKLSEIADKNETNHTNDIKVDSQEDKKDNETKPENTQVVKEKIERRQTRFASFRIPPPLKKERKKKPDVDSPMVEKPKDEEKQNENKQKNIKNSNSPSPNIAASKEIVSSTSPVVKKSKKEIDFSSEDDEPLMKSVNNKKALAEESDESTSKPLKRKFKPLIKFS